jgi:hypothetical protein
MFKFNCHYSSIRRWDLQEGVAVMGGNDDIVKRGVQFPLVLHSLTSATFDSVRRPSPDAGASMLDFPVLRTGTVLYQLYSLCHLL